MRWDENFAAVLLERGFETKYDVIQDDEGNWDTIIEARVKEGHWKPIKQFIEEDIDESLHEIVRGNVLTATRYFQHRIKNFIDRIIMGKNNPMCVSYYSYKVEFQDRGAGHIHGTLWTRIDDLQDMHRGEDGELKPLIEGEKNQGELRGLKQAFKRLRQNMKLDNEDKRALTNFIDEFTTVSIHNNTVGQATATIAQEVNKHHHTKTCRKHDTNCRFGYPRFPSHITIIVEPCKEKDQEKKKEKLAKNRDILRKVKEVLENEESIKKIMENHNKQDETKEEHQGKIKEKIQKLCELAGVTLSSYYTALS